ncbi:MAG: hypothetical protein D6698_05175 [Gammaproteobacteria bacterium]|nr:MAG: hypothetical protein D6698_05175 [Gammaproteobacteria bacterium]
MHLPRAYRSLPRPSSLLKPSNPPIGVFTPAISATYYTTMHDDHCRLFRVEASTTSFIHHFHDALHLMVCKDHVHSGTSFCLRR